ncbi:membrane protein of unknown function [Legionella hackeliae]|uniref:Uncharacterized protein n=1 Tax=Legionella hackeliae TaxID=449 RepID=A0A0A8USN0_LEGHA|nr:membrane protein of unknown function [Legionella hackeliae]
MVVVVLAPELSGVVVVFDVPVSAGVVVSVFVVLLVLVVFVVPVPELSGGVTIVVLGALGFVAGVSTFTFVGAGAVVVRGAPKKYHNAIPAKIIITIIATIPTPLSLLSAMTFSFFSLSSFIIIDF